MRGLAKAIPFAFIAGLVVLSGLAGQFAAVTPAGAQGGPTPEEVPTTTEERPFRLPFAEPSGPDTWLMAQPYGNTTGAYRQRLTTYAASGGIHFGLDLSAPCGTEVVAMADGVVFAVDGPFGSAPHNLMIDHPQVGYATMYGHLLEAPDLAPGQQVKQGEVIALTGDSAERCFLRPHLHLEIRDLKHVRKFNPAALIEANWDNLALTGNNGRDFARDLDEPRKWQSLYDQPEARTAGPILNDFANPWPLDWEKGVLLPATLAGSAGSAAVEGVNLITAPLRSLPFGRQVTTGTCCTQPYWSPDSGEVRFIDRPAATLPVGVWGVDLTQPETGPRLVTGRLGVFSRDGELVAYPERNSGMVVVERLADGQSWEFDTQGRSLSFTPDGRQVMWTVYDEDAPRDNREEAIWLADVDGGGARVLLRDRRSDTVAWLSAGELLMSRRLPGTSDVELFRLSIADGSQQVFTQAPRMRRMRGTDLSPDGRYMVYYNSFETDADENGVWLLDLRNAAIPPQKLPFFGTYRWRDSERLIYVPFDVNATQHNFYEYDVRTGDSRALFEAGTNLTIANNDWQVSPDGRKIVLLAAQGTALDGIWVLDIDQGDTAAPRRAAPIPR
jgi:hypothetical protein